MLLPGCTSAPFQPTLGEDRPDAPVRTTTPPRASFRSLGLDRDPALPLSVARDLEGICAADFRVRALAQIAVLARGVEVLPSLERALALTLRGSRIHATCRLLMEQVQRRRSSEELACELQEAKGYRRLSAIRSAGRRGPEVVPALLPLVAHRDPEVRREAVVALRSITCRHPLETGEGPVQAIRVWRDWYDRECLRRHTAAAAPDPVPRAVPLVPSVSIAIDF
jgi:HEAT repeat protein